MRPPASAPPLLNLAETPSSAILSAMGLVDDETVCQALGFSIRTLERRISEGLPVVKLGSKRLFSLQSLKDYLLSQELGRREPPRPVGRPKLRRK